MTQFLKWHSSKSLTAALIRFINRVSRCKQSRRRKLRREIPHTQAMPKNGQNPLHLDYMAYQNGGGTLPLADEYNQQGNAPAIHKQMCALMAAFF